MSKEVSYHDALKDVQKLAISLKKSFAKISESLNNAPEELKIQSREEKRKENYEKNKKKYRFTDREKTEVLDRYIDEWNVPDVDMEPSDEYYGTDEYLLETVPNFFKDARDILIAARDQIMDLLPATTVASPSVKRNPAEVFKRYGRKRKLNFIEEEDDPEEDTDIEK
jgi:hypothetical protein